MIRTTARPYARLLTSPHRRWAFVGAFLGRVPHAMEVVGTVVFIKTAIGSFAVAGLVAGAVAAGIAAGSVIQGRRTDRQGSKLLLPLAAAHLALMIILVLGGNQTWGSPALVAIGFSVGCSVPPTSSLIRTLYPKVFSTPADVRLAFALDSALTDVTYVAGPGLVSIGILLSGPEAVMVCAAAAGLASVLVLQRWFPAVTGASRPDDVPGGRTALRATGIRAVTLATFPVGVALGMCEVAYPAFGSAHDQLALGGLLLALAGAAKFRVRARVWIERRVTHAERHVLPLQLVVSGGLRAADTRIGPLAVAALTLPIGLVSGPWVAARNELTASLAEPGTAVEAYSWLVTALLAGTAVGTALAGPLVEHGSWRLALLVAAAAASPVGVLAVAHRRHLAPT